MKHCFMFFVMALCLGVFAVAQVGGNIIRKTIPAQYDENGIQVSSQQTVYLRQTLTWGQCTSAWSLLITERPEDELPTLRRILIDEGIAGLEERGYECVPIVILEQ